MSVLNLRAGTSGSVTAMLGELGGREVVLVEIGPGAIPSRTLSLTDGEKLAHAAETALDTQLPLVAVVDATGPLVRDGIQASHGWGRAARALVRTSGVVPVILCVTGPAISSSALLLGLADQVVMTMDAHAFVNGPTMVRQYTGVNLDALDLGGAESHWTRTGVASLLATDRAEALDLTAELLAHLPDHCDQAPRCRPCWDPLDRPVAEAGELLPPNPAGTYDVRDVLRAVLDDNELLELRGGWASNLVTALATLAGRPVGIVANQPLHLAGTLDIPASQKGARFVGFCDAFNLPIITFVDTPGFLPGKDLEWRGMIRHGAQLAFAYARATVPRICVTLRKSYGGAYIVMDSKEMGNDLALAWPGAEIAVMGARGAVEILHRGSPDAERNLLQEAYSERLLNPYVAAERGSIDQVIEPSETRRILTRAVTSLEEKRERMIGRPHDNSPL